jgi:hypothetical protein
VLSIAGDLNSTITNRVLLAGMRVLRVNVIELLPAEFISKFEMGC